MLTLAAGLSSVVVVPELGAALLGWLRGPVAVLRRALPQAVLGDSHAAGCFPLLPYANRIANGRFAWNGREVTLAHPAGDQPHTIHGIGRDRAWTVEAAAADSVRLSLSHQADAAWPFAFEASLAYTLTDRSLAAELAITNRAAEDAPAGLGLHPYFPKQYDAALRFDAAGVWVTGPDTLPLRHGPVPEGWSHATPRPVAPSRLDNCFTGWSGPAEIQAGPASLRIEASEAFTNLQVFTPGWGEFFAVEPVTHTPDAINRPDLPSDQAMARLAPGQTLSGWIRLTVTG